MLSEARQLQLEALTELIWANFPAWEDSNDPGRMAEAIAQFWQPAVEAAVRADQIEKDAAIADYFPAGPSARAAEHIRAQLDGGGDV